MSVSVCLCLCVCVYSGDSRVSRVVIAAFEWLLYVSCIGCVRVAQFTESDVYVYAVCTWSISNPTFGKHRVGVRAIYAQN